MIREISASEWFEAVQIQFNAVANPEKAIAMAAYMKNNFQFLGIPKPIRSEETKKLFTKYPPKIIYVSSSRILCAKNAEFQKMKDGGGSAVAYAWYVWEKGNINNTIIKWVN